MPPRAMFNFNSEFSDQNLNNVAQTQTNVSAESHSFNGHDLR